MDIIFVPTLPSNKLEVSIIVVYKILIIQMKLYQISLFQTVAKYD